MKNNLETKLIEALLSTTTYDEMNDEQLELVVQYEVSKWKKDVYRWSKGMKSVEELKEKIHEMWLDYRFADGTETELDKYAEEIFANRKTFLEIINECIESGKEFDANIGDVDMPATFCFPDDMEITPYCLEKYGDLLTSYADLHKDVAGRYTDSVEVYYDDSNKGKEFALALAGWVSIEEYKKLFNV